MNSNCLLNLDNKVAIITGAATGLGAATAKLLSQAGVKLIINHMYGQEKQAAEVSSDCVGETLTIAADITKDDDCRELSQTAIKQWGHIDILVNNAGINNPVEHTDLDGLSAQDFLTIYNVNVVGAYQMTRAVASAMQAQGCGVVVNVSSESGESGYGSSVAYAASKGALNTMTRALSRALAPAIRVNAICPGMVVTTLWDKLGHSEEQRVAWLKQVIDEIPLKSEPTPEIVARVILFLASDLSSHLMGQLLTADGGTSLGLYHPMYDN